MGGVVPILAVIIFALVVAPLSFSMWVLNKEVACEHDNNVYDCQIIAVPSPQVTD